MESVLAGVATCVALCGDVMAAIFGNPYLATFAGAGLLGLGITVFSAIKGAAR